MIIQALKDAEITEEKESGEKLTRTYLYEKGYIGGENSSIKRKSLLKLLHFPERMNTTTLIDSVNRLMSLEEFERLISSENNTEE